MFHFRYYDYILSINGKAERHGFNYEEDYLTDVIGRKAENGIKGNIQAPWILRDIQTSPGH